MRFQRLTELLSMYHGTPAEVKLVGAGITAHLLVTILSRSEAMPALFALLASRSSPGTVALSWQDWDSSPGSSSRTTSRPAAPPS